MADPPYSALVDTATLTLLALSRYPYVVSILAKGQTLEAEEAHGVNWPNYRRSFTIIDDPKNYPDWTWDQRTRKFSPAVPSPALKERSALAVSKCQAIWEIVYELSAVRYQVWTGLILQESVYRAKREQAQKFLDDKCPTERLPDYPHVLYYSEWAQLEPDEAAQEILFKAKLDDDLLAKTEIVRLKFFDLVRKATARDLPGIMEDFRREAYRKPRY
jgi:hypothetical protein